MGSRGTDIEPQDQGDHDGSGEPRGVADGRLSAPAAVAYAVLFLSLAIGTVPRLLTITREAIGLRRLAYKERRARVNGELYIAVREIASTMAPQEPVAVVQHPAPKNTGLAMLADYYFYPRRVKLYSTSRAYEADKSPARPVTIGYIDIAGSPVLRRSTYAEIRAHEIGSEFVVHSLVPDHVAQSFIVPMMASGEGPPPDVYTTEGVAENSGPSEAHVTFEMFPSGSRADVVLQPGERRTWNDAAYQLFGSVDVGWMRVTADHPIRSQFWFVNRGRSSAAVLQAVDRVSENATTLAAPERGKLWIVNPNDRALSFTFNGERRGAGALTLTGIPASGTVRVEGDGPLFAYVSWRDKNGDTHFVWPEKR